MEGEDPSARKVLEGGTTLSLLYMLKFRPKRLTSREGKEKKTVGVNDDRLPPCLFFLSLVLGSSE